MNAPHCFTTDSKSKSVMMINVQRSTRSWNGDFIYSLITYAKSNAVFFGQFTIDDPKSIIFTSFRFYMHIKLLLLQIFVMFLYIFFGGGEGF